MVTISASSIAACTLAAGNSLTSRSPTMTMASPSLRPAAHAFDCGSTFAATGNRPRSSTSTPLALPTASDKAMPSCVCGSVSGSVSDTLRSTTKWSGRVFKAGRSSLRPRPVVRLPQISMMRSPRRRPRRDAAPPAFTDPTVGSSTPHSTSNSKRETCSSKHICRRTIPTLAPLPRDVMGDGLAGEAESLFAFGDNEPIDAACPSVDAGDEAATFPSTVAVVERTGDSAGLAAAVETDALGLTAPAPASGLFVFFTSTGSSPCHSMTASSSSASASAIARLS
mmetsp:Transcript_119677/g.343803  ORF Transcript_119677/g.343803 Transcript_119677/m.343803 type:complete len:282 (-) Transcript_119677:762-1607(-)